MQVFIFDEQQYNDGRVEMIVHKGGSRMHPEPKFLVNGLNPDDEYQMKMRLELVDEFRYHYKNEQWTPSMPAGPNAHMSRLNQLESRKEKGATWHSTIIQFENLRITKNWKASGKNMIYVEPNHRYLPVLSVVHVSSGVSFDIRFDKLQFMAISFRKKVPVRRHFALMDSSEDEAPDVPVAQNQAVPYQWPSYGFYPQPYDYYFGVPQLQYPVQYPIQIQYPQPQNPVTQYVPEYGWNSILVPGFESQEVGRHSQFEEDMLHDIWAPRQMELENLYFLTEQGYQPLFVY